MGLAPTSLIAKATPGAVYVVQDAAIAFPTERIPDSGRRTEHVTRRAIVVQAATHCRTSSPKTILVVPCSCSGAAGPCDMPLPDGEPGFDAPGVVAYASLVQPILKSELVDHRGQLSSDTLLKLQRLLLENLGVVQSESLDLPHRATGH